MIATILQYLLGATLGIFLGMRVYRNERREQFKGYSTKYE